MPYIKPEDRQKIDEDINRLILSIKVEWPSEYARCGILNYTITRLLHCVYRMDAPSYEKINSAIGVLECAKQELYRRKASPYEDRKINENGEV